MDVSDIKIADARFDEDEDDQEILSHFFKSLDQNNDGQISGSEFDSALLRLTSTECQELLDACKAQMQRHIKENGGRGITLKAFTEVANQIPRARGQRVQWVKSIGLDGALARRLTPGTLFNQLSGIKEMSEEGLTQICKDFCKDVPMLAKAAWEKLRQTGEGRTAAETHVNTKFSKDDAFEGEFASLDQFYAGPESLIGHPNPQVEKGIRKEHCDRKNARDPFTTPNYNITTCPYDEWRFVMDPEQGHIYPHTPKNKKEWKANSGWKGECGREPQPLDEFLKLDLIKKAELQKPEVGALRLYTGPMYILFNAVLRNHPETYVKHLQGNKYETTIFSISSGVAKMSKFSRIPVKRLLYRGLGGMLLPKNFWVGQDGFRGGVEYGLMSTTADKSIAIQYSGKDKKRATIFEIEAGRIDIGADLSIISQYPGEQEFLMPPLSCLEVVGNPRVEQTDQGGEIVVFTLRVNMNLKILTFEELTERRKVGCFTLGKDKKGEPEKKRFILEWLVDPDVRQYERIIVNPTRVGPVSNCYNIWPGIRAAKLPAVSEAMERAAMAPVRQHLHEVFCNGVETHTEWTLDLWGNMVQHPWLCSQVIVCLFGKQGCGKDIVLDFFRKGVLGPDITFQTANPELEVLGRFARGLVNMLMVQIDEVKNLHDHTDKIKNAVTADTVNYEEKGRKPLTVKNIANLWCTTNNENVLRVSTDDRRSVLFHCSPRYCGNTEYFNDLAEHLFNSDPDKVARGVYQALMKRDLSAYPSNFQASRPITQYYKEMQLLSIPISGRFLSALYNHPQRQERLSVTRAYELCRSMATRFGYGFFKNVSVFGKSLCKYEGVGTDRATSERFYTFDYDVLHRYLVANNQFDPDADIGV